MLQLPKTCILRSALFISLVGLVSCTGSEKKTDGSQSPSQASGVQSAGNSNKLDNDKLAGGVAKIETGIGAETEYKEFVSSPDPKTGFRLRKYKERVMINGLRVLVVPDDTLPSFSISLLVRGGSSRDPVDMPGLGNFIGELLESGTAKKDAIQVANALAKLGADFSTSVGYDYNVASASSLSSDTLALTELFYEIVSAPAFADEEITRVRKQLLSSVVRQLDQPESIADRTFAKVMYGGHPYASSPLGNVKSLELIKKRNIIQHYLKYFRPNNSTLTIVGKVSPENLAAIENVFSVWAPKIVVDDSFAQIPAVQGKSYFLVDKPGLVQAQIRIGNLGIARADSDFIALRVANTILGGGFASRLVDRVRKQLGLTYSISSTFDARFDRGPFEISTFTKNATVKQAIQETQKVLAEFHDKGVTGEELARAKGYLKGLFPQAIETPEKFAFNLMVLRFHGIPDTYLSTYLQEIDSISVAEVNRVIRRWFDAENLKVVVYSSASEVKEQMDSLGGTVTVIPANDLK